MALGTAALAFLALALLAHLISIGLATSRVSRARALRFREPVSIVRPVCGIDAYERATLASTFSLDHPDYEVVFCCATDTDPVVPLVRELMAQHPHIAARLLIGDERPTANPKLNNLMKGWVAAKHEWIVLADSNVLMPADYLDQMWSRWSKDTGLVCSPPVGCLARGFWAEVECAFLNTYQARWQLAADSIGLGFAQGKSMLWSRRTLDEKGGVAVLGREIAEDAAATKIVREKGLSVHLVDRPFPQPLDARTRAQVLDRQVRWARLRRVTFAGFYGLEILTGILPPLAAAAIAAAQFDVAVPVALGLVALAWYGAEFLLNERAGWHWTWRTPLAWIARDALLPAIWFSGWMGSTFTWRGNSMSVAAQGSRPTADRLPNEAVVR